MDVNELVRRADLKVLSGAEGLKGSVAGGYCGDLLSDVMGSAPAGCIWLTVQGHHNVMNVVQMREKAAVLLVNGVLPDDEMRRRADEFGIPLISWPGTSYDMAVKLVEARI